MGRAAGLGLGGAMLLALLAGCSAEDVGKKFGHFGWPGPGISLQAHKMYDLWIASTVAALVVGVGVWGLIFWCVIRYRKRGEELPVQTRFNMPMEVLYTVTPVLIVAVLFYYTAIVQTDVDKLSKNPDQVVQVTAFKWNWEFDYRDGIGTEAKTVASTVGSSDVIPILVVPTHEKIRFEEISKDVIHSFWVPELLFKRDVMPGNVRNVFEVTLDKEGRYVGRCAELCGTYHAFMNFELVAVTSAEFDKFLAAKTAGQSTQDALTSIGKAPYATTTQPFNTRRQTHSWNQSGATEAAGK
ncbi:aa3-type cytochrome oxidase subunit II [Actinoplanes teichomyceticus]|uniref:Cytochrome c oxidase subunit 2 n=1 Tax=Actinoplanes teichomyceticus TaxID=1867 RepID=A0A561WIQ9_ACTTI|nr:cytochrome c oxidase subunit II [Actinoplanes teichomyceticus]TWG23762.1 cytochrome c oxidase subunit 2 [Actinoplanes teichomyceticus]GIF11807.1 cytochrome c oxidase subunit II [Actinoplanes teichomyceticus]